jgi:hypothetical protein
MATYFDEDTRASQVRTLIDTAANCGYEKNTELFERMFEVVYSHESANDNVGGYVYRGDFVATFVKTIADIITARNTAE